MTGRCCCDRAAPADSTPPPPSIARRSAGIVGWVVPGALLALVPKCPACLAAYVALWTGMSLSLPTAKYLRLALLAACVTSLTYAAVRWAYPVVEVLFTRKARVK